MSDGGACRFFLGPRPYRVPPKCGRIKIMTANGNAFHAFIEDARATLDSQTALDYYQQDLPSDADTRLYDIVQTVRDADAPQRQAFISSLSEPQRALFGLFAHRAATLAVRLESPDWLENAILASVIANTPVPESRNIDLQLAILHHCARKLNRSPIELFDWAATYAAEPLAAHLEQFGRRDDIALKKFGWVERRTPDGVRYAYQWR